jgi:uncharacterized repeat protein (TIGR03803 family)
MRNPAFARLWHLGLTVLLGIPAASAQTETVLYSFTGQPEGPDAIAGVAVDSVGNVYGTTEYGGASDMGSVYKIIPPSQPGGAWTYTTLHNFQGPPADGVQPVGGLIADSQGNLYGTTYGGGNRDCGTVFEVTAAGVEMILHNFQCKPVDGSLPIGNLTRDSKGNLYGTTYSGGAAGGGSVFEVTAAGKEKLLYSFQRNATDGHAPYAGVIRDGEGNLYGTTALGGTYHQGTVYKVTPAGAETVLYSFEPHGGRAVIPECTLARDSAGNLYGTAGGGAYAQGAVFKLTPEGVENIIHSFKGGPQDGSNPVAGLIIDSRGNLYGTTQQGGSHDFGTIFEMTGTGNETILYSFQGMPDGNLPVAAVFMDGEGNLYGTTEYGGTDKSGTVFQFVP